MAPPFDIPEIGRCAVIADPTGAILGVIASPGGMKAPFEGSDAMPSGRIGWCELMSGDAKGAIAFYGALFGWKQVDAMEMTGGAVYYLFAYADAGEGEMHGGIMDKMPDMEMASWSYYINVTDLDAAIERLKARGGQVVNGPMQVPGGSWIVNFIDDQGGYCSLIGSR